MSIETLAKLATVIVGAITAWNVIVGLLKGRKNQLRDEYRFARDFVADLEGVAGKSNFLRQRGCYAIAGHADMEFKTLEYLWGLPNPALAIQDYSLGFRYLEHTVTTSSGPPIGFAAKYSSSRKRAILKAWYTTLYFVTYLLACSPLLLQVFGLWGASSPFPALAFACLIFLPLAFLSLKVRVRITRAERLVDDQGGRPRPPSRLTGVADASPRHAHRSETA